MSFPSPYKAITGQGQNMNVNEVNAARMISDWQRRLQALQKASEKPKLSLNQPNVGGVAYDAATDYTAQQQAMQAAATANSATASQLASVASTSGGQQTGNGSITDNLEIKPGRYYSDVTPVNIGQLISDPAQAMNYWSEHQGYNTAYGKRMSSIFNIAPLLQAMGVGQGSAGSQLTGTNALDWYGRLADRMSGRLTDQGNYQYLNPQSIVQNIFNTPKFGLGSNAGVSDLSVSINNPQLQPEQQIGNVAQYVLGALQGVLTNEQLDAYAQILDLYANQFMKMNQTTPGGTGDLTFLEYVRQQTGQYGGIF